MKKFIFLVSVLSGIMLFGPGDPCFAIEGSFTGDAARDGSYHVKSATATSNPYTFTFDGFATDVHFKVTNGTGAFSTSYMINGTTITVYAGQDFDQTFIRPVSSPTVITATLIGGASAQITVGGIKTDR